MTVVIISVQYQFLPLSWYGRDRKMATVGHPSQRPKSICSSAYFGTTFWYF